MEKKLQLFRERTFPLLTHYSEKGVVIEKINVEADTTPEDIRQLLDSKEFEGLLEKGGKEYLRR